MNDELIIACPTCKKSLRWKDAKDHRPFCSKRCQLIDLGEWANENHAIAGEPVITEHDEDKDYT